MKTNFSKNTIVVLPRAGLANKLLIWSRAYVFASINNLPLTTLGWTSIHLGPLLRKEKSKRFYLNYFNENNWFTKLKARLIIYLKINIEYEPPISKTNNVLLNFKFDKVLFWMHFFDSISEHQHIVKKAFLTELLTKKNRQIYSAIENPEIGIHIRRGDFRQKKENEKFDKEVVLIQTPLYYFIECVKFIRNNSRQNLSVTIFSDGSSEELSEILKLENVKLHTSKTDLEDLLTLSKSKIIIPSPSSTFGLFAAYLSDAIILHHPDFYMRPIRKSEIYEGPIHFTSPHLNNDNLIKAIQSI